MAKNKIINCKFDFGQSSFISQIEDTQMMIETKFHCPYAETFVSPTRCMFAGECLYQERSEKK